MPRQPKPYLSVEFTRWVLSLTPATQPKGK